MHWFYQLGIIKWMNLMLFPIKSSWNRLPWALITLKNSKSLCINLNIKGRLNFHHQVPVWGAASHRAWIPRRQQTKTNDHQVPGLVPPWGERTDKHEGDTDQMCVCVWVCGQSSLLWYISQDLRDFLLKVTPSQIEFTLPSPKIGN